MAGRKSFDDDAFRALLKDSLQDLEVTARLRERTLEACRNALAATTSEMETNGPAGRPEDAPSHGAPSLVEIVPQAGNLPQTEGMPQTGDMPQTGGMTPVGGARRVLPFVGRHAVFIRTAAGLAACLLLAVLIMQFYPRMGSYRAADRTSNDHAVAAQSARNEASSGAPALSAAAAAPEQPEGVMAKSSAAGDGSADSNGETNTGDAAARTGEAGPAEPESDAPAAGEAATETVRLPAVTFSESMVADTPAGTSAAPEAAPVYGIRGGEGAMAVAVAARMWFSYGAGLWTSPLPERPTDAEAEAAAQGYERTHAGETGEPDRRFATLHLSQPLSGDLLAAASSPTDLLARDAAGGGAQVGLWMMPVRQGDTRALVPLTVNADGVGTADPVIVDGADTWLDTLADEAALRGAMEAACGVPVTSWTVVDVDSGAGFWVSWQANGVEWILPFMDRATDLGLENGRPYTWDALVTTVAPFL